MRKILIILLIFPLFTIYASVRIVSLAPNITEIIYELNLQDNLVGRSEACNYPETCKNIPSIGNPWKPDIEKILSLKPDLVLASSLTDQYSLEMINKAGIKAERINYEDSIDGTYKTIERVGQLTGKETESENLIKSIRSRIEDVQQIISHVGKKKKALYLMSWINGTNYAATGETFIDGILNKAGLINIAADSKYWVVSNELIIRENPDIILIPKYNGKEPDIKNLKKTKPFKNMESQIIIIDGDAVERQGARTAFAVIEIAKSAYPEYF